MECEKMEKARGCRKREHMDLFEGWRVEWMGRCMDMWINSLIPRFDPLHHTFPSLSISRVIPVILELQSPNTMATFNELSLNYQPR